MELNIKVIDEKYVEITCPNGKVLNKRTGMVYSEVIDEATNVSNYEGVEI